MLEEEEITVIEDGKESTYYVGKHGEQKSAIMTDAFKSKSKVNVKEVQKPKLTFYDADGNLIKAIDLASEKSKGMIMETRPRHVKGEFAAEMTTVKQPKVSLNGKYAAMNNTTYEKAVEGGYTVAFGKLILFDVAGNVLFEKEYPYGWGIVDETKIAVADNGTIAVVISEGDEGPADERLHAYNKNGNRVLDYPQESSLADSVEVLKVSPNGRYLAARVGFEYKYTRTVFFDLKEHTVWKADRSYVVYDISDSGSVTADYHDEVKGGPSDTVSIDLAQRMKP